MKWALLAVSCCLGCSETPIDVVRALELDAGDVQSEQDAGLDGAAYSGCTATSGTAEVGPGLVRIRQRSSELCLGRAGPITIAGDPAFDVALAVCSDDLQSWRLIAADFALFNARHVSTEYNLDIKFAATSDGTPAVLYPPHQLYNQRFAFDPRDDGALSIAPRNVPAKCLTQVGLEAQIFPCEPADPAQAWELLTVPCP